jgi:hypothetical protein
MAQVMFSFLGVCTYFPKFRDYDHSPDAPSHRMLLVNAGENALKRLPPRLKRLKIDPHTASIHIFHEIVNVDGPKGFPLDSKQTLTMTDKLGFRVWVEGAATAGVQENGIDGLPGLQSQLKAAKVPRPDPLVVSDGNPQTASVYVDFDSGTISGLWLPILNSGMGITQLVIETPGREDDPIPVKFRQFQSDNEWTVWLKPEVAVPGSADPTGIVVQNMPTDGLKDDPQDFLLQYLAVKPFPPIDDIRLVTEALPLPKSHFTYGMPPRLFTEDADPGCSNSHYP